MASSRRKYRSVRQSLANSTQARASCPDAVPTWPQALKQGKGIGGGPRQTGQNLATRQAPNLAGIGFKTVLIRVT